MKILSQQKDQNHRRAYPALWIRHMDTFEKDGSSSGWNLHPSSRVRVQNISWKTHPTKGQIYADLLPISSILKARRIQFAGHCFFRAEREIISSLLLWTPSTHSRIRKLSYPDVIARDAGIDRRDLGRVMQDRETWRKCMNSIISTAVD